LEFPISVKRRMKRMLSGDGRKSARCALFALAVLALSLSPLRALCDVGFVHASHTAGAHQTEHGDGGSALCCTIVDDRAAVNSATLDLSAGKGATFAFAALASVMIAVGFLFPPVRVAGAPPPPQSYYARSARILR
jgi:hypothetical protein